MEFRIEDLNKEDAEYIGRKNYEYISRNRQIDHN